MVHRGAITRTPQSYPTTTYGNALQLQAVSGSASPQMEIMKRQDVEKERDDSLKRAQQLSIDESSRAPESTPLPSLRERRRRSFVSDVTIAQPQSSVSQSPSSGYFPSPMQPPLPNVRAFSSASSLGFTGNHMLPPISPSSQPQSQPSHAALTAHLQDLQHQVGTKAIALQTLQAEYNHLLSAYQRSQLRCGTLEKKFQVSDTEINNLTEERNRLQAQCEGFEKQVEELLEQRDAANKLSIANGGQYTSILQQASRLELKSLSDWKKWRAEKEEWERQKEEMERRIKQLEIEKEEGFVGSKKPHALENSSGLLRKSQNPSDSPTGGLPDHRASILTLTFVPGDIILSTNPDDLREEIVRLRQKINDLDRTLQELKTEGQRIDQIISGISAISRGVIAKVDAVTAVTATPEGTSAIEDAMHQ
ncbi:hypothetical protein FGG08_004738 [Glutinoglossum americanum]|uniref:Uncharacterized protein n=1 Tax=Glutinoglossum americanum TaxID=1670608 RepID=A0A9P8KZ78_9PEZI|nr:hypothetical protein FGG08_004738 [Glutinoglossum americanum]